MAFKGNIKDLEALIVDIINDTKGEDITTIDLANKSYTDKMIVASGTSNKHNIAIAEKLQFALKKSGIKGINIEGKETAEWILLDLGNIIVHIFVPHILQKYAIHDLWKHSPEVQQESK